MVYIIHHRILDRIGGFRQDQAPLIFHYIMGAGPEEACKAPALLLGHGILGLVPVAPALRRCQNGHFREILPADTVQTGFHPLRFQPALLFIIHMPEIAAAAELGNGAFPVYPMGRFFQNFRHFSRRPGFLGLFDPHQHTLTGNGIWNKHGAALNMGHTLSLGGIIGNHRFVNLILNKHRFLPIQAPFSQVGRTFSPIAKMFWGSL